MARKRSSRIPVPGPGEFIEPLLPGVSQGGRWVAAALMILGRDATEFQASDAEIVETLKSINRPRLSVRYVQKALKELRDGGHVETERGGGRRTIRILFRIDPNGRIGGSWT